MNNKLEQITIKKQQLDKLKPLPAETLKSLEDWLRVELTYSSNAIEGNVLSRIETAQVIEKGVKVALRGKPLKDQLEAINHSKALDFIKNLSKVKKSHQFIDEEDIKVIHKIILTGIMDEAAGIYRQSEVFITGTDVEFPPHQKIPFLMREFVNWLSQEQGNHPVRIGADAHFKLVSIHPFIDGNGRTARLLMNLILIINSYPAAIIRYEDRIKYLEAVNEGHTKNQLNSYYSIVEDAVERSLDGYLNAARGKPAIPVLLGRDKDIKFLTIGELAKAARETKVAIRFWTKEGLLQVAKQTRAGYALYHSQMIDKVREIRMLQREKRLSIAEIKKEIQRVKKVPLASQ